MPKHGTETSYRSTLEPYANSDFETHFFDMDPGVMTCVVGFELPYHIASGTTLLIRKDPGCILSRLLLLLLVLKVLVANISENAANENDAVEANAQAGAVGVAIVGSLGGGSGSGSRVARLALQSADEELVKTLAGLVRVADILESLRGILASNVKYNLLTTRVLINKFGAVVDLVVDYKEAVLLCVVLGNILKTELLDFGHFSFSCLG